MSVFTAVLFLTSRQMWVGEKKETKKNETSEKGQFHHHSNQRAHFIQLTQQHKAGNWTLCFFHLVLAIRLVPFALGVRYSRQGAMVISPLFLKTSLPFSPSTMATMVDPPRPLAAPREAYLAPVIGWQISDTFNGCPILSIVRPYPYRPPLALRRHKFQPRLYKFEKKRPLCFFSTS